MSNMMLAAIYAFQGLEMLNGTFYSFADFWVNKFPWVFYSTEITFSFGDLQFIFSSVFLLIPITYFKKEIYGI